MKECVIYHNPRCSKSRGAVELVTGKGINVRVVEYLKQPLSEESLRTLLHQLSDPPGSLVRTKEADFAPEEVDLTDVTSVARYLAAHPHHMERPVVVWGDRAVIARPPEKVFELVS